MKKLTQINLYPDGGYKGFGPLGFENSDPWASYSTLNKVISMSVGVMTAIAAIWLVFKLVLGGLGLMSAGGDKNKLAEARASITTGVIGFVVIIASLFVLDLFGNILGIRLLDGMSVFMDANYNPLL